MGSKVIKISGFQWKKYFGDLEKSILGQKMGIISKLSYHRVLEWAHRISKHQIWLEMFEGYSADMCAAKFLLTSMGVQAEGLVWADPGSKTHIGWNTLLSSEIILETSKMLWLPQTEIEETDICSNQNEFRLIIVSGQQFFSDPNFFPTKKFIRPKKVLTKQFIRPKKVLTKIVIDWNLSLNKFKTLKF